MTREQIDAAIAKVSQQEKDDIKFSYDRVSKFAQHQRDSMVEFETELSPGLFAGQKLIPMTTAGCYVPGGRYAHIASAIMSVATAKVAGVENVVACSVPHGEGIEGIHPIPFCDRLRDGPVWSRIRFWRWARRADGMCRNGFRTVYRKPGRYPGGPRKPFRCRSQTPVVRSRRYRPVCRTDRNRDHCR